MLSTTPIRRAANRDCRQIIELILPIQQIEFNVPVALENQPDLLDIETNYHKTGGCFWVAEDGTQINGTIGLISLGHNTGAIRKMFVMKEFRGKEAGIAQRLIDTLTLYAREAGITDIYLGSVDSMKAAHRFYERNGFIRISKNELPAYFPLMPADNVFYHLHLKSSIRLPQMNIIDQSGILAISTRMQRLSEQMRKDAQMIYKAHGIEFEPKWFPVVYTLHIKGVLSVVEIAAEIGYSHPSTISLLKELEKQKLVRSKKDKTDDRKRLIQLSAKGNLLVEQMKPVWELITATITELTNTTNNLMKAIEEVEEQMKKQTFFNRAMRLVEEKKNYLNP